MFKALILQLKQCGIETKEEKLVLTILSKIGPDYSVFVLTFYATKLIAWTWKMPNLVDFMESITQEQDKLVMMGTIKPSKDQDFGCWRFKVGFKKQKKRKKSTWEKERQGKVSRGVLGLQEEPPEEEEQRRNEQVRILQ